MDAFPRCPESTLIFRKFLYECAGPGHFPGLWGCRIRHYEAPATRPVARQARELQVSCHAHTCFHKSVLLCCCVPRMSVLMLQVKASGWTVFGVLDPLATKCVNRHVHRMFEESASTDHTEVFTICVQLPLLMECCSSCNVYLTAATYPKLKCHLGESLWDSHTLRDRLAKLSLCHRFHCCLTTVLCPTRCGVHCTTTVTTLTDRSLLTLSLKCLLHAPPARCPLLDWVVSEWISVCTAFIYLYLNSNPSMARKHHTNLTSESLDLRVPWHV